MQKLNFIQVKMKTYGLIDHVRMKPQMYCPFYENSLAIFELALHFLMDSHIAACSNRLLIDYEGNTVRFRAFGKPIFFEEMRGMFEDALWLGVGMCSNYCEISKRDHHDIAMMLMGLCKEMELTSFHARNRLTCRSVDDARCGTESRTDEADGVAMSLTHEKEFEPAYVNGMILQFHALFPDLEIGVNGKELLKSNGLMDLLYQKLNPSRILEPLFSYRSDDLDFAAALQVYPGIEGGPFVVSYLNGYETFKGGDHYNIVMDALLGLKGPFKIEEICIIFHCKKNRMENYGDAAFESIDHAAMYFKSKSTKNDFERKVAALLNRINRDAGR